MKITKKHIISLILLFCISIFLIYSFNDNIRYLKEKIILKNNYQIKKNDFQNSLDKLSKYPSLEIYFHSDSSLCLVVSSDFDSSETIESWYDYKNYNRYSRFFLYGDTAINYMGMHSTDWKIQYTDTCLNVISLKDQTSHLEKKWTVEYSGGIETKQFHRLVEFIGIDKGLIDSLKFDLKNLGCFGYRKKDSNNMILYYRTDETFTDRSIYFLTKENDSTFHLFNKRHMLDSNIYWEIRSSILSQFREYYKLKNIDL